MDSLEQLLSPVAALLSTLGGFALIMLLARLKVPIALAIAAGAAAVGLLFGQGATELGGTMLGGVIQPKTVAIAVLVALLLVLSGAMHHTGRIDRMVSLVRSILRRPAVSMAALPAMIGLLPMPGGALFSAPMVASAAGSTAVEGARLSAVNFWFRHLWEYWWPLYPGVILAMQVAGEKLGVGQGTFIAFQLPMSAIMMLSGLSIFRGSHPDLHVGGPRPPRGAKRRLLLTLWPIWMIPLVWGLCKLAIFAFGLDFLPVSARDIVERYVTIGLGVAASLVCTIRAGAVDWGAVGRLVAARSVYKMVLVVISALVFMYVLDVVQAGEAMGRELKGLGLPPVVVVAVLPLIAGAVLGVAVGFVGTSFPIVLSLVAGRGNAMGYVALAYAFGHMGQMLSPIHICCIVSNQFFKTNYRAVYRYVLPAAVATAAGATGYFLLLRWLL